MSTGRRSLLARHAGGGVTVQIGEETQTEKPGRVQLSCRPGTVHRERCSAEWVCSALQWMDYPGTIASVAAAVEVRWASTAEW